MRLGEQEFPESLLMNIFSQSKELKNLIGKTILFKMGGSILNDDETMQNLVNEIVMLRYLGIRVVIVHGGGPVINSELKKRNVESSFHEGQRITSDEVLESVEYALMCRVNKKLVKCFIKSGANAIGMSGIDCNMLQCDRFDENLGHVGRIRKVRTSGLRTILNTQKMNELGIIPVIASIGFDENQNYNINADWVASSLASRLRVRNLVYLTDQQGILDGEMKLISNVSTEEILDLIDQKVIRDGMLVKVRTIIDCLSQGIDNIYIVNGRQNLALTRKILLGDCIGTKCYDGLRANKNIFKSMYRTVWTKSLISYKKNALVG